MYNTKKLHYNFIITCILFLFLNGYQSEGESNFEEEELICDACKIIAQRFANSFKNAELEVGRRKLNEDEYIEAAESTCDEDWSGFGLMKVNGVQRLMGKDDQTDSSVQIQPDQIWDRRLQDFCDELLSEAPDEKTLYNTWSSDITALENYLCKGEGIFKACVAGEDFGPWPGDDYDDYDDFDYVHDEF